MSSNTMALEYNEKTTPNWSKDPDINRLFLASSHSYLADRLRVHGYLFLNEVLEQLGLKRVPEGQLVGWRHTEGQEVALWDAIRPDGYDYPIAILFRHDGEIYKEI